MALAQFEFKHAALDRVLLAMEACIGLAAGLVGKELSLVTKLHALVVADAGANPVFERFGHVQGLLLSLRKASGKTKAQASDEQC